MKVLLIAEGSRGDTQPIIALTKELEAAGHKAILSGPASSTSFAKSHGINYHPLNDFAREVSADPEMRRRIAENKKQAIRDIRNKYKQAFLTILNQLTDLAKGDAKDSDVVLCKPGSPGVHLAEWLGIPFIQYVLAPLPVYIGSRLPPRLSAALMTLKGDSPYYTRSVSGILGVLTSRGVFTREIHEWRRGALNLPSARNRRRPLCGPDGHRSPLLQAFSLHTISGFSDFPNGVHTTGFWYLPKLPEWKPSQELQEFLDDGEPPIYVGFGSVIGTDPSRITRIVSEALRIVDMRAIVAAGWGGIDSTNLRNTKTLIVDEVPYDWLFPQLSAVVHHGGAGTAAIALASNCPQIVCPSVADTPFWAREMYACGVATSPQPESQLNAPDLARAIRYATTNQAMTKRIKELGKLIRAENGTTDAVNVIESSIRRTAR